MLAIKPRNRQKKPKLKPFDGIILDPSMVIELQNFVRFGLGDDHLTAWEENFLNTIKQLMRQDTVRLTFKQCDIIGEIKAKLHFDRPDDPLPPIDPDGLVENDDPDGWPLEDPASDDARWERDDQ